METVFNLDRFVGAQQLKFDTALSEIKNGKKESHWMWYIFPQIVGLGFSDYNVFYGIKNIEEASQYLQHPVLGKRLIEITTELLEIERKSAKEILGKPDDRKLKSCMTLFSQIESSNPIFQAVLDKYFEGSLDEKTLQLLRIAQ